jgi:hypothetical protein
LRYIESDGERFLKEEMSEIKSNYDLLEQENQKMRNAILDVTPCGSDEHIGFILWPKSKPSKISAKAGSRLLHAVCVCWSLAWHAL